MTKKIIEAGYNDLSNSLDISKNSDLVKIVENTIEDLNKGKIRVAEKINGEWVVNDWIKKLFYCILAFLKIL